MLIAARLLKPLGSPQPNGVKYFTTAEIASLVQDRQWLGKMTSAISRHWQTRNQRKLHRGLAVAPPPAQEQFRLSA